MEGTVDGRDARSSNPDLLLRAPFQLSRGAVVEELKATGKFDFMTTAVDEAEHSIEMHLPYIVKAMERYVVADGHKTAPVGPLFPTFFSGAQVDRAGPSTCVPFLVLLLF